MVGKVYTLYNFALECTCDYTTAIKISDTSIKPQASAPPPLWTSSADRPTARPQAITDLSQGEFALSTILYKWIHTACTFWVPSLCVMFQDSPKLLS